MGDHWYALSRSMVQHYTIKLVDCISLYFCVVDFSPLSFCLLFVSFSMNLSPSVCLSICLTLFLSIFLFFLNPWAHNISSLKISKLPQCLFDRKGIRFAVSFILFILVSIFIGHLTLLFYADFYLLWLEVCPIAILFRVSLFILRSWVKQHWPLLSQVCICENDHCMLYAQIISRLGSSCNVVASFPCPFSSWLSPRILSPFAGMSRVQGLKPLLRSDNIHHPVDLINDL